MEIKKPMAMSAGKPLGYAEGAVVYGSHVEDYCGAPRAGIGNEMSWI